MKWTEISYTWLHVSNIHFLFFVCKQIEKLFEKPLKLKNYKSHAYWLVRCVVGYEDILVLKKNLFFWEYVIKIKSWRSFCTAEPVVLDSRTTKVVPVPVHWSKIFGYNCWSCLCRLYLIFIDICSLPQFLGLRGITWYNLFFSAPKFGDQSSQHRVQHPDDGVR